MHPDPRPSRHRSQARRRLARQLAEPGLDGLLVSHPVNVGYLTGFTGEASFLLLGRRRTILVSDGRFAEQIAEECPGLDVHIRPADQTTLAAVGEVITREGFRKVGIEAGHLTVAEFEALREAVEPADFVPTRGLVEGLRAIKADWEVERIRAAIAIAERAFSAFKARLRPEDNELVLVDQLEMEVRRAGGLCSSFPPIVAMDERSALPHAPPCHIELINSDFMLVDWGASGPAHKSAWLGVHGHGGPLYNSDLTRLLVTRRSWFRQPPPRKHRDDAKLESVYRAVLAAQEAAAAALRPGVQAPAVDAAARAALAAAGYEKYFTHGLGHGLGLQVHEAPAVRKNSTDELQAGMVCTLEPGVYLPGWGGVRIEDDFLITPDGCERLTTLPRDFASAQLG